MKAILVLLLSGLKWGKLATTGGTMLVSHGHGLVDLSGLLALRYEDDMLSRPVQQADLPFTDRCLI